MSSGNGMKAKSTRPMTTSGTVGAVGGMNGNIPQNNNFLRGGGGALPRNIHGR